MDLKKKISDHFFPNPWKHYLQDQNQIVNYMRMDASLQYERPFFISRNEIDSEKTSFTLEK